MPALGELDFTDRVAIVTGVGRQGQIGFAVAQGLGRAGAGLLISDRNAVGVEARAKELAADGIETRFLAGDLTQADFAQRMVEQTLRDFGRLDVLVNVAGGLTGIGPALGAPADALAREVTINLETVWTVTRAAARAMVAAKRGAIVNFASIAALNAKPSLAAYSAAKAGVASLTRSLALELREHGVRVNAVAPGTMRTADNLQSMGQAAGVRWVELDQLVNAVLFLASDLAAGITGHVLPVSHGES